MHDTCIKIKKKKLWLLSLEKQTVGILIGRMAWMWTLCGLVQDISFSENYTAFIFGVVERCFLPIFWQPLAECRMP